MLTRCQEYTHSLSVGIQFNHGVALLVVPLIMLFSYGNVAVLLIMTCATRNQKSRRSPYSDEVVRIYSLHHTTVLIV